MMCKGPIYWPFESIFHEMLSLVLCRDDFFFLMLFQKLSNDDDRVGRITPTSPVLFQ